MSVAATTLLVCTVLAAGVFGALALRRRLRGSGPSGADVAAAQRRSLAANWSAVEAAAIRAGMSADEIAAVRRNLLGG